MNKHSLPIALGNGIPIWYRALTVEIPITSVGSNGLPFKFPDNQILRTDGARIYGLDAFVSSQQAISPGGANVVTGAGSTGLIVTLQDTKSVNRIQEEPYFTFISASNTGYTRMFKPFEISLENSNIKITDVTNLTVNQVALFSILYYTDQDVEIYYDQLRKSISRQQQPGK